MSWYIGVLSDAERFMPSWHKSQEEAINSKLREVNRAAKALLANHKTKTRESKANQNKAKQNKTKQSKAKRDRGRDRDGKCRKGASSNSLASEQPVHCFFERFFFCLLFPNSLFCCLDLPPPGAYLLMNGFDLTARLESTLLFFFLPRVFSVVA